MSVSRKNTPRSSTRVTAQSDLARVDAHEIMAGEYEEAPDLSDFSLADGQLEIAGKPAKRGRPVKVDRKLSTTIRLDPDILDHFKAQGRGWQGRINAALRKSLKA